MLERLDKAIQWFNNNEGFLSVIMFALPIIFLWIKGAFSSLANILKNADIETRIKLLERNLALNERMQKDFLKENWFQECYQYDLIKSLQNPSDKFIEPEIFIRSITDDTYPEVIEKRGISLWFKLASKDFYHNGLCCMGYLWPALIDEFGNWTVVYNSTQWNDYFKKITVRPLYYIPFSKIVNYDLERNEYGDGPTIFCKFDGVEGGPYAKIEFREFGEDKTLDPYPLPERMRFSDSFFGWKKLYLRRFWYRLKKLLKP